MQRRLKLAACALLALAASPAAAAAQDPIAGDWDVNVSIMGQQIPLTLHVAEGEKGLEGVYDAQGMEGIPILSIAHEHPAIRIELETGDAPAILEGTHEGDTLSGEFTQGAATGTFTATKKAPDENGAQDGPPGDGR